MPEWCSYFEDLLNSGKLSGYKGNRTASSVNKKTPPISLAGGEFSKTSNDYCVKDFLSNDKDEVLFYEVSCGQWFKCYCAGVSVSAIV